MKQSRVSLRFQLAGTILAAGFLLFGLMSPNEARAAVAFQAAGTAVYGTNAQSPTWPTHLADDIALLFIETSCADASYPTLSTANGFTYLSTQVTTSTCASTDGTRLTIYWARATSSSMAAPTISITGVNHIVAQILTYRG